MTKFIYKDGRVEKGRLLAVTPHTYFVQFDVLSFGTIWKADLVEVI
jgi:hypothetical protein